MVIPRKLCLYGVHSYFFDDFERHPWEAGGGINLYSIKTRSWRLNLQVMKVYKSSAGGTFDYTMPAKRVLPSHSEPTSFFEKCLNIDRQLNLISCTMLLTS
jgi:hypothetical protein